MNRAIPQKSYPSKTENFLRKTKEEILIFLIIFLSRLPFSFNSPGIDPDNWLVLHTGKMISETGVYRASRLPGYPVNEYIAAALKGENFFILNLLSIIFTSLMCIIFYKILRELKIKAAFFAAITLGFVQAIFIASTTNMEYTWSLFFLLLSFLLILQKKFYILGTTLAIMVVLRIPNIIFIPFFIYLYFIFCKIDFFKYTIITISSFMLVFFLGFAGVFNTYGLNILPKEIDFFFNIKEFLSLGSLFLYGLLGVIGILLGLIFIILNYRKRYYKNFDQFSVLIFSGFIISANYIMFLRFPFESYYLIPSIPFIILIFSLFLKNKQAVYVFSALLLSPFFLYISMQSIKAKGSLFVNEKMEDDILKYAKDVNLEYRNIDNNRKILVAGGLVYIYKINFKNVKNSDKILKYPSENLIKYYKSKGYDIYYLSIAKEDIRKKCHYQISKYAEEVGGEFLFDR